MKTRYAFSYALYAAPPLMHRIQCYTLVHMAKCNLLHGIIRTIAKNKPPAEVSLSRVLNSLLLFVHHKGHLTFMHIVKTCLHFWASSIVLLHVYSDLCLTARLLSWISPLCLFFLNHVLTWFTTVILWILLLRIKLQHMEWIVVQPTGYTFFICPSAHAALGSGCLGYVHTNKF